MATAIERPRSFGGSAGTYPARPPNVSPPPPPSGNFYGVAELPRRQARWSGDLPAPSTALVSHTWRLGASPTWSQFETAFLSACNHVDTAPRWIVLPATADIAPTMSTGFLVPPRRATPVHPIIVCSEAWFDGVIALTNNVRIGPDHHTTQPAIRTMQINAPVSSDSTAHLHHVGTQDILYVDIFLKTCTTNHAGYDRGLAWHGYSDMLQTAYARNSDVGALAFRWCTTGMTSFFRADNGQWRNGMSWAFYVDGEHFTFKDGRHLGHGALGSQGADRGFISGVQSAGAWTVTNNELRDPGGIGILHGGWIRDAVTAPNECADVTFRFNHVWRTEGLRPASPTALRDSANATCPWGSKNIFEIKTGLRWDVRHNLFLGDWTLGQAQAVVLKSVWQGAKDLVERTADVVFAENIVWAQGKCPFSISSVEVDYLSFTEEQRGTGRVRAMERCEVAGNLFVSTANINSGWLANLAVRTDIPAGWSEGETDKIALRGNAFLLQDTNSGEWYIRGIGLSTRSTVGLRYTDLTIAGNIVGPENNPATFFHAIAETGPGDPPASALGWDALTDAPSYFPGLSLGVNARIGITNAYGDGSAPTQVEYASLAAAGLTRGSTPDQWTQSLGSSLRTAGPGGTRLGPDFDALAAMRTAVMAGTP